MPVKQKDPPQHHPVSPSHGSDHFLGSTMVTANGSAPSQAARTLDRNLTHTPPWNSAMTQMRIPPLDRFHPFHQHSRASRASRASQTGSISRPNTPSTSLAALTIAVPPLRTSRTGNSHPFVLGYSMVAPPLHPRPYRQSQASSSPQP